MSKTKSKKSSKQGKIKRANFKIWSKEEEDLLKNLRPNNTIGTIWNHFINAGYNRTKKAIAHKCNVMGLKYTPIKKNIDPRQEAKYIKQATKRIEKLKRLYITDVRTKSRGLPAVNTKRRKILCLSDAHIPFSRDDLILKAINKHSDADILVINGDWLDLQAVSKWPKDRQILLLHEYNIALEYFKVFSKKFPKVVVTRGNHEFRLNRYFNDKTEDTVSFLVQKEILIPLTNGVIFNPIGDIEKVLDFSNVYYEPGPEAWFTQIGKTVFVHPQSFSRVNGKISVMAWEYFMDREDIDSVVSGHTHQQSFLIERGRLLIEQGCLSLPLDYAKQGKLTYKPQTLGYTVIYQDVKGNTDFNMSHNVFLGIQYPIKKSFEQLMKSRGDY